MGEGLSCVLEEAFGGLLACFFPKGSRTMLTLLHTSSCRGFSLQHSNYLKIVVGMYCAPTYTNSLLVMENYFIKYEFKY